MVLFLKDIVIWTRMTKAMPLFSKSSLSKLSTCHPDLQVLFFEVIRHVDCTVIEGHRDEEGQEKAFEDGKSKLQWPNGKHNGHPSMAIDVSPFPIPDWNKGVKDFIFFNGFVLGIAARLKAEGKMMYGVRSGCDWNQNVIR